MARQKLPRDVMLHPLCAILPLKFKLIFFLKKNSSYLGLLILESDFFFLIHVFFSEGLFLWTSARRFFVFVFKHGSQQKDKYENFGGKVKLQKRKEKPYIIVFINCINKNKSKAKAMCFHSDTYYFINFHPESKTEIGVSCCNSSSSYSSSLLSERVFLEEIKLGKHEEKSLYCIENLKLSTGTTILEKATKAISQNIFKK